MFWGAAWFVFPFLEKRITAVTGEFYRSSSVEYLGLLIVFLGVCIFITAMAVMKSSWRVGIDNKTKTTLVTSGIYRFSRNPAFVGFDLMFTGFLITYPNFVSLLISIACMLALHMLLLQEEKHLRSVFGNGYLQYCSRTPRYILFK